MQTGWGEGLNAGGIPDAATPPRVAIIDYEMGNLFSVCRACALVGINPVITSDSADMLSCDAAILPGTGAFGDAMDNLKRLDLTAPIRDFISTGKPFFGVCLGLQLLFSESEEFGRHEGLGIIEGSVVKFPTTGPGGERIKVPQVGWNSIGGSADEGERCLRWNMSPLKGLNQGVFMYFVHSYYVLPASKDVSLCLTSYAGINYVSGIMKENIFASQFHPEISGTDGIHIYRNLKSMIDGGDRQ